MSVFVIAEAGVNHDGDSAKARELVVAAADAGADAVKFQTFTAEHLVVPGAAKADYQEKAGAAGTDQLAMLKSLELDRKTHHELMALCATHGIEFMSTAFDEGSLRFLVNDLGIRRVKVPSGEITNGPFLVPMARSGLPLIVSTGMSSLDEVRDALAVLAFGMSHDSASPPSRQAFLAALADEPARRMLSARVTLLHCTSSYPAPVEETNLRAMATLRETFDLPVGLSDHTPGIAVPIAAAALEATVIEKHLTLDCRAHGPDHAASIEPQAFAEMVAGIRAAEAALGSPEKRPGEAERATIPAARRSLVALETIRRGDRFSEANLGARRPGTGLDPMTFWDLLGREASRDYAPGDLIEA